MNNKNIFASNLKRYMDMHGKSRKDVSLAIGVSYYTLTDWVNGKKFPRMDKVERLANYFGILKSDLIEGRQEKTVTIESDGLDELDMRLVSLVKQLSEQEKQMLVAQMEALIRLKEQ